MAANLDILITARNSASAGLRSAARDLGRLDDAAQRATSSFRRIAEFAGGDLLARGVVAFADGAVRAGRAIMQTTELASNLGESINKTGVVFGQSASEILRWSQSTADALGQSQAQALEAAGTFGNLFTSIGLTRKESANMSTALVELASDLASFNNIDPAEALEKLRSGLTGETEPLRTLGVFLNEATVQAKAMEMGLAATAKELTEADKVTARYALILGQTVNAQGDFARTADSTANAQRRVNAQIENYATTLGRAFEPIRGRILTELADILERMAPYAENIMNQFALGLARGINQVAPILADLGRLIRFWLQPGSPPRLLPDLDKWGTGAADAYLEGWTRADFGAFDTLASSISSALSSLTRSGQLGEGGVFGAITGSRTALADAVNEFSRTGAVSQSTMSAISASAGAAGQSIEALARTYFNLNRAQESTRRAQEELNRVQERYNDALNPLNSELRDVQRQRQAIRDNQRLLELRDTINNPFASADDRALAQLEAREIDLRRRQQAIEDERDTAVQAAQDKLAAAQAAQDIAQEQYSMAQANLQQEIEYNNILAQRQDYLRQVAAEQQRIAEEQQRAAERAAAEQQRLAEQAAREQQRMIEAAIREQEQVRAAQLAYAMATTDTAGKIAILRGELDKYNPSQVEYWQTLTQIAQLEDQLAKSRASGGGLALPEIPPLELPDLSELDSVSGGFNELADAIKNAFDAITGEGAHAEQSFEEHTQMMMDHVLTFKNNSYAELGFWTRDIQLLFALFRAGMEGDNERMWDEILRYTQVATANEQAGLEGAWNRTLLRFIENRGNLRKTAAETWELMHKAQGEWLARMATDLSTWLSSRLTVMYNHGRALVQSVWDGWRAVWSQFTSYINGLQMPWSNWQLPSWLQRNSPSELEQSLMGTAKAIADIQRASNANGMFNGRLAAQTAGDVYNINIPQQFAPGADVGGARQATRQGIDDSVLMARRRRGR